MGCVNSPCASGVPCWSPVWLNTIRIWPSWFRSACARWARSSRCTPSRRNSRRGLLPWAFELSYGKPAETVELDFDVVDPLHVAEMTSAERALLVARVLEQHPHLAELVPLRLRAVAEAEEGYPLKAEWSTGTPTRVI